MSWIRQVTAATLGRCIGALARWEPELKQRLLKLSLDFSAAWWSSYHLQGVLIDAGAQRTADGDTLKWLY